MATLVLTAVGTAIGGPIGGAIGAALGQRVDAAIFGPKPREGARLKELQVQTSSYGSRVPAIFGVMRVAGTVIWATDLLERRTKSGGGKGRPSTINYSYTVSMAVAVSSRPIARIGRIWADGNLVRGSAGDLKVDTQLRIYTGHGDQPVDPLIASAERSGHCPAHRGVAYAMFEDLQLADYGNRIPSLTFEIFERDGVVPVNAVFEEAGGDVLIGQSGQTLLGFALEGSTGRESVASLLDTMPIELVSYDGKLIVRDSGSQAGAMTAPVALQENGESFDRPLQTHDGSGQFPHVLALRYYDVDRDFQASIQQSERGSFSFNALQVDLPIVLNAVQAKRLVEQQHHELLSGRRRWKGNNARGGQRVTPGDHVLESGGQKWRVEQVEHRLGTMEIMARTALNLEPRGLGSGTPGRNVAPPDLNIGQTRVAILELPATGNEDPGKPLIAVGAAGTGAGWRRAALSLRRGDALIDVGATAAPAVMGVSLDPLPLHNPLVIDEGRGLRVQLLNDAMDIANRDGSPLDVDAPYFCLGEEFVRYGKCEDLGDRIYRLSRLSRHLFRTSPVLSHISGSNFIIPDTNALLPIDGVFVPGEILHVEALGLADPAPVETSLTVDALAVTPPAPVHGIGHLASDGSAHFSWIRRSRVDLGWRDGVDQLMVEGTEAYRVILQINGLPVGEWQSNVPGINFSSSQLVELGMTAGTTMSIAVRQVGRHAQSAPLMIGADY